MFRMTLFIITNEVPLKSPYPVPGISPPEPMILYLRLLILELITSTKILQIRFGTIWVKIMIQTVIHWNGMVQPGF